MTSHKDLKQLSPLLRELSPDQVVFWCPGCESPHTIKINGEHAWTYNNDPESPTFMPSIKVTYPANPKATEEFKEWRTERVCHSHITDGNIQFLDDCTHSKANQTMALPVFKLKHP